MPYDSREFENYVSNNLTQRRSENFNFWAAAGGMTAVGLAGFIPTGENKNLWGHYVRGLQHIEGLSPFHILRTFRASEFLSPLGAPNYLRYSPSSYSHLLSSPAFQDYISKITGLSLSRLEELRAFERGIEYRKTGTSLWGELHVIGGGLLKRETALLSTGYGPGTGFIAEWYARMAGARSPKGFLTPRVERLIDTELARAPDFVPISAPGGKGQVLSQYSHAMLSAGVSRLNLLLQSPFQTELFQNLAKKAPFLKKLIPHIKEGTALQMLGRYSLLAGKVGLGIHGIKYLDYLQRQDSSPLALPRNLIAGGLIGASLGKSGKAALIGAATVGVLGTLPVFEEGFIGGALDIYTRFRVDLARITSPWRAGAKRAEENFEGITDVTTLVGMAGTGLLLGGAHEYFDRLRTIARTYKSTGETGNMLYELADETIKARREAITEKFAGVIDNLQGREKLLAQWVGKWRAAPGYKKGFIAGAGVYGGLSFIGSLLSGDILGASTTALGFGGAGVAWAKGRPLIAGLSMLATFALRGDKSPEELERIYSGEELVGVRRGRWWELGRCNTSESHVFTSAHSYKKASQITTEDTLLGADGKTHAIKNVYKREHKGQVLYITTISDRNQRTGLTPNHILPVVKEKDSLGKYIRKDLREIEFLHAEELEPGDFVQIPIPHYEEVYGAELNLTELIKVGEFLLDGDFIYPAQRNWHSGKVQKSRGPHLPHKLAITEDFGRLIGYFLAEGNISFRGKTNIPQFIETVHAIEEWNIVKDIEKICKDVFGVDVTVRKKTTGEKTKQGCWIVRICSSLLARIFFELFYGSDRENDKRMPAFVYHLGNKKFRLSVVLGYWRGDGHTDRGRKVISSSRKHLVDDTFSFLVAAGYYPTIPKVEVAKYEKKDGNFSIKYRIGWNRLDEYDLAGSQGYLRIEGKLFTKVCSIETEEYNDFVYDFEIDHEDHLLKNGSILVHNSPWEGKRPYFRKHRIALMKEHAREIALYGGEENYWKTDPVFSPIRFLMDPYERDRMMWEQGWRFPITQTPFEDFPIVGPVLAATIGQAIKPVRTVEPEMWLPPEEISPAPAGYANLPAPTPGYKTGLAGTLGESYYRLTEIMGLWGFTAQSLTEVATGEETFFADPQLMSPQVIAGIEPGYWSLNLGGAAGASELWRRFVPHRRREVNLINPMPSGLPSWLPGPNTEYFLDFSRADIYTKFEEPWARLPGPGAAAARFPELKGINPEDWPAFYRYLTLADIAPWSQEYKSYSSFMSQLADSGQLTPEQIMKVSETRKQVAEVKRRKDFDAYKYDMDQVRRQTVTITGEVDAGLFLTEEFGTAPIALAGLNTSVAALARVAKTQAPDISGAEAFRRAEKKRIQVNDYIRDQLRGGGKLDVYIHSDPSMMMKRTAAGPIVPAVALGAAGENINRELTRMGLAERMEQDESILANMAAVSTSQRVFGSFWESLMHGMETPLEVFTPVAPTSKFINQRTPLEDYLRSRIYSREIAMWDKPISHFIAPGLRTVAWWAGWRGLPSDVKQRYMIEEYFDRLEYEKQKRLESAALAQGRGDLAAEYAGQAARTMAGANLFSAHQVYMALPKAERDYFKAFVEAPTREEREEIARYVSPQIREALKAQWMMREMQAAEMRMEAGIGTAEDRDIIQKFWAKRAQIARRQTRLPRRFVPPPNWIGFNPAIQMKDVKLKTILDQGLDMYDYGFWPSDVRELERRPYVEPISEALYTPPPPRIDAPDMISHYRDMLRQHGSQGYDSYTISADNSVNINVYSPGYDRIDRYLRDPTISTFGRY